MNIDYGQLAQQAVDFLKPTLLTAGGKLVNQTLEKAGSGAVEFYHWLKGKFTKPAAAGALQEAVEAPAKEENWEALRVQILKALKEDESFRKEFLELFPKVAPGITTQQRAVIKGDHNVSVQVGGKGNVTNVNRP